MTDLRADLAKTIDLFSPTDGLHESPVSGTYCIKVSHPDPFTKRHGRASFGIVAQGCKEIILGRELYRYDEAHYAVTPIDLPITGRICSATPERPFLGIHIGFDSPALSEVAAQLETGVLEQMPPPVRAMFIGKASDLMLDAALRLGKLFQTPDDAPILGPLVIKELLYHVLKGPDGAAIRQFVRSGNAMQKISQAIYRLRSELAVDVDVAGLAKTATMSRSAFFKHFKEVTGMSPIQYQKRLRLLEARRLMTEDGETAECSAFKVGYDSPSQFSREYSRMFGNSPIRDATSIKKTGRPIHQV